MRYWWQVRSGQGLSSRSEQSDERQNLSYKRYSLELKQGDGVENKSSEIIALLILTLNGSGQPVDHFCNLIFKTGFGPDLVFESLARDDEIGYDIKRAALDLRTWAIIMAQDEDAELGGCRFIKDPLKRKQVSNSLHADYSRQTSRFLFELVKCVMKQWSCVA